MYWKLLNPPWSITASMFCDGYYYRTTMLDTVDINWVLWRPLSTSLLDFLVGWFTLLLEFTRSPAELICTWNLISYNINQWCSVVYRVLDQRRLFWHKKQRFRNTKRSWVFLIILECVKITAVGLKLDRLQLQHWLLFLEHIYLMPIRRINITTYDERDKTAFVKWTYALTSDRLIMCNNLMTDLSIYSKLNIPWSWTYSYAPI